MTNMQTFEYYLKDVHAVDYHGTDDDMSDAFDDFLSDLNADEFLEYGTAYGKKLLKQERWNTQK